MHFWGGEAFINLLYIYTHHFHRTVGPHGFIVCILAKVSNTLGLPFSAVRLGNIYRGLDYELIQTPICEVGLAEQSWGGIPSGGGWAGATPGVTPFKTTPLQSASHYLLVRKLRWKSIILALIHHSINALIHLEQVAHGRWMAPLN